MLSSAGNTGKMLSFLAAKKATEEGVSEGVRKKGIGLDPEGGDLHLRLLLLWVSPV